MNAEDTVMSINAWLDSLGIDRAYKKDMRVTYWYLRPRLEAQARITWDIAIQEGIKQEQKRMTNALRVLHDKGWSLGEVLEGEDTCGTD